MGIVGTAGKMETMSRKKRKPAPRRGRRLPFLAVLGLSAGVLLLLLLATEFESYASLYDAEYVGSNSCGDCHKIIFDQWAVSPHANMTRRPSPATVVGDFDDATWTLPAEAQVRPGDDKPAARMYRQGDEYYMALREPVGESFVPFKIEYVIGYQYRQVYVTREAGGVLRRLPLQWSVERDEFFPYWNEQEKSTPSVPDLWAQMQSLNSAWNLFCARCHTTHLNIVSKDANHTVAETHWVDDGIACEACHGPGSQHVNYFAHNYVNRVVAFINSRLRGEPVAYVANAPKMSRGEDLSVCARCHGTDITMGSTDIYRIYEPGYSREGRINDLSHLFKSVPLTPGREVFTVEVWPDGRPKGIGTLFRSFVESVHYETTEMRCYDCHEAHNNKAPTVPGILEASAASDRYCLDCHGELASRVAEHTGHEPGTEGARCYDCHMPRNISNLVTGVLHFSRTHDTASIPDPARTAAFGGQAFSPNACNECHVDESPEWATGYMAQWYGR